MNTVLAWLLGDSFDDRPAFRFFQVLGLLAAAAIPLFIVLTLAVGRYPSEVQYGTTLLLGLISIFCLRPSFKDADGRRTGLDLLFNLVLIAGLRFRLGLFQRPVRRHRRSSRRVAQPNRPDLLWDRHGGRDVRRPSGRGMAVDRGRACRDGLSAVRPSHAGHSRTPSLLAHPGARDFLQLQRHLRRRTGVGLRHRPDLRPCSELPYESPAPASCSTISPSC